MSQNGEIDPLILGFPELHAVLWKRGKIIDLGTLDEGHESVASAVNSRGQIVGLGLNTISDPNSMVGFGFQTRAFLWQNSAMVDLGTLPGGTDALAISINERGQVMGQSYTADSAPATTPFCSSFPLTAHGFLWETGRMMDIGTLGGSCTFTYGLNNRGQVIGQSAVVGDVTLHPFLWDRGTINDLGTLGGTYGWASWINDAGEIAGTASETGDQALMAFLWRSGVLTALGTVNRDACSVADAINSRGQIVGGSGGFDTGGFFPACENRLIERAFLWEKGNMIDLNSFVPSDSDLALIEATSINDRGEVGGFASLPNGEIHAFLLIPCGAQETEGCQDASAAMAATRIAKMPPGQSSAKPSQSNTFRRLLQHRHGPERLIRVPE